MGSRRARRCGERRGAGGRPQGVRTGRRRAVVGRLQGERSRGRQVHDRGKGRRRGRCRRRVACQAGAPHAPHGGRAPARIAPTPIGPCPAGAVRRPELGGQGVRRGSFVGRGGDLWLIGYVIGSPDRIMHHRGGKLVTTVVGNSDHRGGKPPRRFRGIIHHRGGFLGPPRVPHLLSASAELRADLGPRSEHAVDAHGPPGDGRRPPPLDDEPAGRDELAEDARDGCLAVPAHFAQGRQRWPCNPVIVGEVGDRLEHGPVRRRNERARAEALDQIAIQGEAHASSADRSGILPPSWNRS